MSAPRRRASAARLRRDEPEPLRFTSNDARLRRLNDKPIATNGDFVLYWSQVFRRAEDNAALAYAVERANDLGVACLVYEALRPDYPFASDRIHRFVLEGARETARRLEKRGIAHAFFLPRTPQEARSVVARLTARARLVVSDDFPSFVVPPHNAAAAARAPCAYVAVDDCAVVPMALFGEPEFAARTLRPKLARELDAWLRPLHDPAPKVRARSPIDLPFDAVDLERADLDALIASCAIDHSVPPVGDTCGGSDEAERRLRTFVSRRLATYDRDRNDPSCAGTTGISPYLHFGMVSARRVALAAKARASEVEASALDAFLEELLVRRALSFNFARTRPDHARWSALPAWSKATLLAHANDERYVELSREELEGAASPDELWNATMNELKARGVVQSYARMLWGKLPIMWSRHPELTHATMVHLNDKWALDGRDPNGYANVSWCFGLHDRPWPERAAFGTVRSMTSASARRKLDFEGYIARWNAR